jgi:hypothetical protein
MPVEQSNSLSTSSRLVVVDIAVVELVAAGIEPSLKVMALARGNSLTRSWIYL